MKRKCMHTSVCHPQGAVFLAAFPISAYYGDRTAGLMVLTTWGMNLSNTDFSRITRHRIVSMKRQESIGFIYRFPENTPLCKARQLADAAGFRPPTVQEMLGFLSDKHRREFLRRQGLVLLAPGLTLRKGIADCSVRFSPSDSCLRVLGDGSASYNFSGLLLVPKSIKPPKHTG
jgi:hypothetical protein